MSLLIVVLQRLLVPRSLASPHALRHETTSDSAVGGARRWHVDCAVPVSNQNRMAAMSSMPRDKSVDATLALMRDPYCFIGKRWEQAESDVFEARILLRRTACMRGRDAARVFYDPERSMRKGATS